MPKTLETKKVREKVYSVFQAEPDRRFRPLEVIEKVYGENADDFQIGQVRRQITMLKKDELVNGQGMAGAARYWLNNGQAAPTNGEPRQKRKYTRRNLAAAPPIEVSDLPRQRHRRNGSSTSGMGIAIRVLRVQVTGALSALNELEALANELEAMK